VPGLRLRKTRRDHASVAEASNAPGAISSADLISAADSCFSSRRQPTNMPGMTGAEQAGPYYVIVDVAIRDVERYLTYMQQVVPALEAAGGRYLARGGRAYYL
jgi:hypothetical protein